jgi:Asp-tRNA(Asn)/Glu-tRNA(Gln) amidotransferase A subunit family amidase
METVESIATAVATGSARASDVWAEHVRRHRERHAGLNALIQTRVAAEQDAAMIAAGSSGVLAGVPVSVKECFPVRGLVTTLGLVSRRKDVDAADAEIVVRLAAAGAVVIGKANVPQAMYLHETDNPVWGRTYHPADPERSPGGSSGGDAALVAAGVVPLAVGNDLAGFSPGASPI